MKILAIVCSHAGARSHTAALCEQIFTALNERVFRGEAEYESITMDTVNIGFCRSCCFCFKWNRCPLAEADDINLLKEKILGCDLLLMGSPVYMGGASGSFKNLIDRLAVWCHTLSLAGKLCIPVSTTANNHPTSAVDSIRQYMLLFGNIVLPPVCAYTERGTPYLSKADQMEPVLAGCCENVKAALENPVPFIEDISRVYFKATRQRNELFLSKLKAFELKPHGELEIWEKSGFGSFKTFDELCLSRQTGWNHADFK